MQINTFSNTTGASSYEWQPTTYLDCADCPHPVSLPVESILYQLRITDPKGCTISGQVAIRVEKTRRVYIPNAFSPNDDGENDMFMIFTDEGVVEVLRFDIYDRWGSLLFQKKGFQPNDPAQGWNGQYRGQPLDPGVFTYVAVIRFLDGNVETFKGAITLLR